MLKSSVTRQYLSYSLPNDGCNPKNGGWRLLKATLKQFYKHVVFICKHCSLISLPKAAKSTPAFHKYMQKAYFGSQITVQWFIQLWEVTRLVIISNSINGTFQRVLTCLWPDITVNAKWDWTPLIKKTFACIIVSPFLRSCRGSRLGAGWRDSSWSSLVTDSLWGLGAEPGVPATSILPGLGSSPFCGFSIACVTERPAAKVGN